MIHDAATLPADLDLTCDVAIVGTGAGGAITARALSQAGAKVVLFEEGGHHTSAEFDMEEAKAYPMLYQEQGNRATANLAITVLQGRSVGGGTTVNWTTSFRTPPHVLEHWQKVHELRGSRRRPSRPTGRPSRATWASPRRPRTTSTRTMPSSGTGWGRWAGSASASAAMSAAA